MMKSLFALLLAIFAAGCPSTTEPQRDESSQPADGDTAEKRKEARPRTKPAPAPPSTATVTKRPRKWTRVLELSGSGMKQSQVFALDGNSQRIRYESKCGISMCPFAVYVVPEGHDVMKSGGFPELMVTETEKGDSGLQKEKGRYYLKVTSNSRWKIVLEEQR
jgi:hypothetical protein